MKLCDWMRYENTSIVLSPEEMIQLYMIIQDGSEKEAYEFLRDVVYQRVRRQQDSHCDLQIDWVKLPDYVTRGEKQ